MLCNRIAAVFKGLNQSKQMGRYFKLTPSKLPKGLAVCEHSWQALLFCPDFSIVVINAPHWRLYGSPCAYLLVNKNAGIQRECLHFCVCCFRPRKGCELHRQKQPNTTVKSDATFLVYDNTSTGAIQVFFQIC